MPTTYTADQRQAALAIFSDQGLAAAHTATGVPKSTLRRWATRDGVAAPDEAARAAEQTRAATEARAAERRRTVDEILDRAQLKLALTLDNSLDAILAGLNGGTVPGQMGRHPALGWAKPRDLVGIATRALHDLRLLRDEPTGDDAGGVTVVFATPAPGTTAVQMRPPPAIAELPPLDVDVDDVPDEED